MLFAGLPEEYFVFLLDSHKERMNNVVGKRGFQLWGAQEHLVWGRALIRTVVGLRSLLLKAWLLIHRDYLCMQVIYMPGFMYT